MTETWPAYNIKILSQAHILGEVVQAVDDDAGNTIYQPADHVAIIQVRTELEATLPVPKKLTADPDGNSDAIRRHDISALHHKIDAGNRGPT